jgi:diguanylate cyclase (GGDEF)-like protein
MRITMAAMVTIAILFAVAGVWLAGGAREATLLRATILAAILFEGALCGLLVRAASALGRAGEDALRQELEQLTRDSAIDPITGLGNLRSFQTELQREVARGIRHGSSVALALIEVDAYKTVSDIDGQMAADAMLAGLGALLRGRRAEDQTFRLNGGQFGLILPYTTAREIYPLMEHLRSETERGGHGTTVTIGISDLLPVGDTGDGMRQRAETALSEAKRRGCNSVVALPARRLDALAPSA